MVTYRRIYEMDQISIRGVYTQEANAEADQIIKSNKSLFDINGQPIKVLENEGILSLYELTKE